MNDYISIRHQSCPNHSCQFYGKEYAGNIVSHSKKQKRLKCTACQKTWVVHREEINYRLRTAITKIKDADEMLKNGKSIRFTAHSIQVSPSTIQRWKKHKKISFTSSLCSS